MSLPNPWVLCALAIYTPLILAPLFAWARVGWGRRLVALAAVLFCLGCSLPAFTTTPNGVIGDSLEYGRRWMDNGPVHWQDFFGGLAARRETGWNVWPLSVGLGLTGTWLVERIIGLGWHCLLVISLCVLPLTSAVALPVMLAITCATRFGLWLQRNHAGSEILLQQALLLACLLRLRRSWNWPIAAAASALTALLCYTYSAATVALTYAMIWLGLSWRTVAVYILPAMAGVLLVISGGATFGTPIGLFQAGHWPWYHRWAAVFLSFWNTGASQEISWGWSYPGAQHLPHVACVLILCGVALAVWHAEGRRWAITALVSLTPAMSNWPGFVDGGCSHRQMMGLIPMAVLAGWPFVVLSRHLPQGWTWALCAALALAITILGLWEWHDPQFWGVRWHGFVVVR